jgi:hypothetical protein
MAFLPNGQRLGYATKPYELIEDDEQIQISKVNGAIKNSVHVKHTKGSGNVGARLCEGFQLTNLRLACKKMAF